MLQRKLWRLIKSATCMASTRFDGVPFTPEHTPAGVDLRYGTYRTGVSYAQAHGGAAIFTVRLMVLFTEKHMDASSAGKPCA